ncbi:MAG: hypothetical protein PHP17_07555, partial [Candidatus Omnitrophica bacterium]|nr:hypothetical protein [Candidatus Omnitrophota bacterium]
SNMNKISTQSSIEKIEGIIFILAILFFIVSGWVALTKSWAVSNYLRTGFLCPDRHNGAEALPYRTLRHPDDDIVYAVKPVIYLYPKEKQSTEIKLNYRGNITVAYPEYNNGWNVIAYPDGTIINQPDGKEYSYLFWEGEDSSARYDLSSGFVVKGADAAIFLENKLIELGLTPKEYNEFIVYWLPKMIKNKYNLIHFATKEEYDKRAVLNVNPRPDSILRIFMVLKKIDTDITVTPQTLQPFKRNGFAVVEWGGTEIKE